MKKTVLFCIIIFTFGCSSSDDDSTSQNSINPPSWIQGTWLTSGGDGGFRFDADDFCIVNNFINVALCNKEQLNSFSGTQFFTDVEEEITDTFYSIDITLSTATTSYKFEKISENEIRRLNHFTDTIYTKQ